MTSAKKKHRHEWFGSVCNYIFCGAVRRRRKVTRKSSQITPGEEIVKKVRYPWVRFRVVNFCALVAVPKGWTLDWRPMDDIQQPPAKRWVDGATATIPIGLGDIRLMPGVRGPRSQGKP